MLKLFLFSVFILIAAIYLTKFHPTSDAPVRLFTPQELKQYDGVQQPPLYLSILGKVFDVSKGAQHYGPGAPYHFFTDSSRSFISGRFTEQEADDRVSDLSHEELRSLNQWLGFYGKSYPFVGRLIGRYYGPNGKLTRYGKEVRKLIRQAAEQSAEKERERARYPPCNVEWDADRGSRVWCTARSGGVSRDWVGVPRKLYEPGSGTFRCACVQPTRLTPNLQKYPGCDDSNECYIKE